MNTGDIIKLVTRDIPNNLQSDNILISDSMYKAVTEMQEDTFCSVYKGRINSNTSGYELVISPEFLGSDYHKDLKPNNKFNIIPIRVDAVWKVLNNKLYPVYLYDSRHIRLYDDRETATIELSGYKTVLRTSYDIKNIEFEVWIRYKIPYIQSAFISPVVINSVQVDIRNSLIETIPERYHDLLVRGVKFHIYNSLTERTNSDAYVALRNVYEEEWKNKILPRIAQESNRPLDKETTYVIKVPQVFGQND